ncbi:MAG TPA: periplasmic heavy metal sensor [Parvularculaceae bacterium]|nr:periplasmic heavy metal sensor [Parvularculaceae bacterium]HNS85266.1 periplasmic heavy metal sensor [Parvularculaceae bacterium]
MNRGVIVALALSLAANVFLAGMFSGRIMDWPGRDGSHHAHDWKGKHKRSLEDLTPAARESLRRAFVEHRQGHEAAQNEALALHRRLVETLSAETYDRATADAIIEQFKALDLRSRSDMARLIVEAADGLPLEDRKALARHLEARAERSMKRHREPPPPGE